MSILITLNDTIKCLDYDNNLINIYGEDIGENLSYFGFNIEENFISDNGKYRVLLAPDKQDNKWPEAVRVGSGAKTMALLDDVPIWFELWRQLNGFPPNYYQPKEIIEKSSK